MENSKSVESNTGYKGICFDKERGNFKTQVVTRTLKSKEVINLYVGRYLSLKEAVKAREEFIKSLF